MKQDVIVKALVVPGEDPSRGLLHDCLNRWIVCNSIFYFLLSDVRTNVRRRPRTRTTSCSPTSPRRCRRYTTRRSTSRPSGGSSDLAAQLSSLSNTWLPGSGRRCVTRRPRWRWRRRGWRPGATAPTWSCAGTRPTTGSCRRSAHSDHRHHNYLKFNYLQRAFCIS